MRLLRALLYVGGVLVVLAQFLAVGLIVLLSCDMAAR